MTLTSKDFDEMKTIFPTKVEVLNKFDKVDRRFSRLDKKIDKKLNEVMKTLLWLVKKFKKFDEEQTVIAHRVSNHEDRIENLESHFVVS